MPCWPAWWMASLLVVPVFILYFLRKLATHGYGSVRTVQVSGKIFLTVFVIRRRHGQAGYRTGPEGGRACPGALPEPASGAGARPGVPVQRLLRRPRPGAGQVRDGAAGGGRRGPRAPRRRRGAGFP